MKLVNFPTAEGTLVVALASKIIVWQPQNDARADFAVPEKGWPKVRSNDARPDPAGNFWVGTMQNNVGDDGSDNGRRGNNAAGSDGDAALLRL